MVDHDDEQGHGAEQSDERCTAGRSEGVRRAGVEGRRDRVGSVAQLVSLLSFAQSDQDFSSAESAVSLDSMANDGSTFWFQTNKDATNDKVARVDVSASPIIFEDVIAEDPSAVLEQAKVVKDDYLLLLYSKDVNNQLYLHRLSNGKRIRQFLPDFVGSIGGISGRRRYDEFFTSVGSYTDAGSIYQFDLSDERAIENDDLKLVRSTKTSLQPSDFISEQIFYHSKDGTRIPARYSRAIETPPCLTKYLTRSFSFVSADDGHEVEGRQAGRDGALLAVRLRRVFHLARSAILALVDDLGQELWRSPGCV